MRSHIETSSEVIEATACEARKEGGKITFRFAIYSEGTGAPKRADLSRINGDKWINGDKDKWG